MNTGFVFSKRIFYASIFAVLIIGGAFFVSQKKPTAIVTAEPKKESTTETFTTGVIPETKQEEQDTTHTSEEDQAAPNAPENLAETTLTKTDILTRNVLKPYLDQSNSDTYSATDKERIITHATKEMFTLDFTPYTIVDILTKPETTKEATIQYKKELGAALQPLFELNEYELTIYGRAIQNNSKEDFDTLKSIASVYNSASASALLVKAPNDVSAVHLALINSLKKFSMVLTELAKGYDDPAASLAGTGNFTQAEDEVSHAFSQLQTYFILKEVDKITL